MKETEGNKDGKVILRPFWQGLLFGGAALVLMLGALMVAQNPLKIWMMSSTILLIFAVLTHLQSIKAVAYGKYLQESLMAFMFTFIALGVLSTFLSGISIFDAGHYRTIYIIILASYFFFMGMVMLVKSFLNFLEDKDANLN